MTQSNMNTTFTHFFIAGDRARVFEVCRDKALTAHYPAYIRDTSIRTRISVLVAKPEDVHDFLFEYQELMDNSFRRIVDLRQGKPRIETYKPQYEGLRKDFVDVEWEFIIGHLSNPILQEKLRRWSANPKRKLTVALCHDDEEKNRRLADIFRRRLPGAAVEVHDLDPESEARHMAEMMEMAKYLHYFYQASYELKHVPTDLPEEEVDKAWYALDDTLKTSNICNVMSIPHKMELLGHDRADWNTFYALSAEEIERLTEIEHNRWCVERLIQGSRPCTDRERKEVEEDMRRRLADPDYARANPVSLKKRYKTERNAHFDLCAFSELGVDGTGLPVSRYDRDLTAAIPLIVKTYTERHRNG